VHVANVIGKLATGTVLVQHCVNLFTSGTWTNTEQIMQIAELNPIPKTNNKSKRHDMHAVPALVNYIKYHAQNQVQEIVNLVNC
jgi:hypothetical protein